MSLLPRGRLVVVTIGGETPLLECFRVKRSFDPALVANEAKGSLPPDANQRTFTDWLIEQRYLRRISHNGWHLGGLV